MVTKEIKYFSLAQICDSGQCFRMRRIGENHFSLVASDRYLEAEQTGKEVAFACSQDEFESFWKHYFDLDTDYGNYIEKIDPKDQYLKAAAEAGRGIRILNQDLWEMIVSFLISQQNNIVRIRRCIQNICQRYGEEKRFGDGTGYFAFPTPSALSMATEEELKECNLGYRAKYVLRAAKDVTDGRISLKTLQEMKYPKAREELLKFYGVGEKVADCICLFALHQLEAFPVDTHIRQALDSHYKRGFPKRRYKGMDGVMQQYIFYYELQGGHGHV